MANTKRDQREVQSVGVGAAAAGVNSITVPRRLRNAIPPIIALGLILLFWENFNWIFDQPDWLLPPISKILTTAITQAGSKYIPHGWITLQEIIFGFLLGVGTGFILGVIVFHSRVLRQALLPLILGSQAIPAIAIAPVLVIWFGFGMEPKILITALIVFFPVFVNTFSGFNSIERDSINLMSSLGAGQWQVFWKVRFPGSLPYIFTGLKIAATISPIGAIVGEWVGSHQGLGPVMIAANAAFKTDIVFGAILYLAMMAITLFLMVNLLERWLIPWYFVGTQKEDQGGII